MKPKGTWCVAASDNQVDAIRSLRNGDVVGVESRRSNKSDTLF